MSSVNLVLLALEHIDELGEKLLEEKLLRYSSSNLKQILNKQKDWTRTIRNDLNTEYRYE